MLSADSVPAPICVILASEVRLYREGIASALSSHGRLRIVATPGNRPDAAAAVRTLQPEVVIVDMSMAGALELTAELRRRRSASWRWRCERTSPPYPSARGPVPMGS